MGDAMMCLGNMPQIGRGDSVDFRVFGPVPELTGCERCGHFLSEHTCDTSRSCLVTGEKTGRIGILCPSHSGM